MNAATIRSERKGPAGSSAYDETIQIEASILLRGESRLTFADGDCSCSCLRSGGVLYFLGPSIRLRERSTHTLDVLTVGAATLQWVRMDMY